MLSLDSMKNCETAQHSIQDINNFLNSLNELLSIQTVNFLTDNTLQLIHFRTLKRQQLQRQIIKNTNKITPRRLSQSSFFPQTLNLFLMVLNWFSHACQLSIILSIRGQRILTESYIKKYLKEHCLTAREA